MGLFRPKVLSDLSKIDADLRVTCPACGRSGVYQLKAVTGYFHARRWNMAWEAAGARFTCTGWPHKPGCGHRGAILGWVPREVPVKVEPPLSRDAIKMRARRERG